MDEDQGPAQIGAQPGTPSTTRRTLSSRVQGFKRAFFTREGLIGDYDYAFLFTPSIPFVRRRVQSAPFFALNQNLPVLLAILLGLQHALAMLAGIITPPIILASAANLSAEMEQYLVSTSLIVSGILSMIQITRFHIYKTPYVVLLPFVKNDELTTWYLDTTLGPV